MGNAVMLTDRHLRLKAPAPQVSTNNITVTYMISEFDQSGAASPTPITLSGTRIRYGSDFDKLTSEVAASNVRHRRRDHYRKRRCNNWNQ